jgi:hypothetical protein
MELEAEAKPLRTFCLPRRPPGVGESFPRGEIFLWGLALGKRGVGAVCRDGGVVWQEAWPGPLVVH